MSAPPEDPRPQQVSDSLSASAPLPPHESPAPLLRSEELLQGHREILIAHCQEVYRLRLTRNGKLLLTK